MSKTRNNIRSLLHFSSDEEEEGRQSFKKRFGGKTVTFYSPRRPEAENEQSNSERERSKIGEDQSKRSPQANNEDEENGDENDDEEVIQASIEDDLGISGTESEVEPRQEEEDEIRDSTPISDETTAERSQTSDDDDEISKHLQPFDPEKPTTQIDQGRICENCSNILEVDEKCQSCEDDHTKDLDCMRCEENEESCPRHALRRSEPYNFWRCNYPSCKALFNLNEAECGDCKQKVNYRRGTKPVPEEHTATPEESENFSENEADQSQRSPQVASKDQRGSSSSSSSSSGSSSSSSDSENDDIPESSPTVKGK